MNVDLKEIRRIVELMNEHGLTHFHVQSKDFTLKLRKGADVEALRGLLGGPAPPGAAAASVPAADPPLAAEPEGVEVTSPMVGTFYRRAAPGSDEFVKVGDPVSEGQTLCIIEAMKVMNEIKAERAGIVTAVLVDDGTPVQYGDPLFRIR